MRQPTLKRKTLPNPGALPCDPVSGTWFTGPALRRLALDLRDEDLVSVPRLPEGEAPDRALAALLRELFTQPDGTLEARAGAVLLDDAGQPRGLTAPFGGEWPRAEVQALEIFATARKVCWHRLVLFRADPTPRSEPPGMDFQFALEMRTLGILFAVEVEDLLILKPHGHWTLSRIPVLRAGLHCEVTLDRALGSLMASGFERSLPPIGPADDFATGHRFQGAGELVRGPWAAFQAESL